MWRLRNRLIVTYVFIGVIPIVLLVAMVLFAAYLFAGQFATYIALSDLESRIAAFTAANDALAAQFRNLKPVREFDSEVGGRNRQRNG